MTKLALPQPDDPTDGNDIAWRRELKQLRLRVAELEVERGNRQSPSIDVKRSEKHGYQCTGVYVYEKEPRVECRSCGVLLDPVAVLLDYARHERNFCYSLEHLRKENRELQADNKKLKAIKLRLRGDVRKLLPAIPAQPGQRKWDRDMLINYILDCVVDRMPEV